MCARRIRGWSLLICRKIAVLKFTVFVLHEEKPKGRPASIFYQKSAHNPIVQGVAIRWAGRTPVSAIIAEAAPRYGGFSHVTPRLRVRKLLTEVGFWCPVSEGDKLVSRF
jgi:hypothetical protein